MFELIFIIYTVANTQPAALSTMKSISYGIYANLPDCQLAGKNINPMQLFGPGIGNLEVVAACVPKAPVNGTVIAKYMVLTIVYAPPGTDGGMSKSSVVYGAGSTTGVTTSAMDSFKTMSSFAFQAGVGLAGNGVSAGASFGSSQSSTASESLDLKKTSNSIITVSGPGQDGIDHDYDQIWLLLSPPINLSVTESAVAWTLANPSPSSVVQFLTVGQLKGTQQIAPGVTRWLQSAGITAADYPQILARDPLANGASSLDAERFLLQSSLPYIPPPAPSGSPPTIQTINQSYSSNTTVGQQRADSYSVGLTITQSLNFFVTDKLTDETMWTWTNTTQSSASTGTSESAAVNIAGPAYGYAGPTSLNIYYDTMYKTFAFTLVDPGELAVSGTLGTAAGAPLGAAEVTLNDNNTTRRTFTNARGEFRFYGNVSDNATIEAPGVVAPQRLPSGQRKGIVLQRN